MSTHVQKVLQERIYSILSTDTILFGVCGLTGVFDFVKDNQSFPYVKIGDDVLNDWSNHSDCGFQGTSTIHSWSQAAGKAQVMGIMDRIYMLLNNVDLALVGFKTVSCRQGQSRILLDPDGYTHHGIQIFNLMLGGN